MRVDVHEQGYLVLKEVYNGIKMISKNGEIFQICMRDSGYEFMYDGKQFEAKEGEVSQVITKRG